MASLLQVMIDIDGQHEWRDCLDIPGVRLPLGYYFGASAITGDLSGKQLCQLNDEHFGRSTAATYCFFIILIVYQHWSSSSLDIYR